MTRKQARSKSPIDKNFLNDSQPTKLQILRNQLSHMFDRCSSREQEIKELKQKQKMIVCIKRQNQQLSNELKKLRQMVKNALLMREKQRTVIEKINEVAVSKGCKIKGGKEKEN